MRARIPEVAMKPMRALARLKAAGLPHCLLIAGGEGWLFAPIQAQVAALGLAQDVHFTGYIPATDLPALYSGATAVLQPTLYEGFGFPVLEAQACGTAVLTATTSSLPEVAGEGALLVDPLDTAALAAALRRVAMEDGLRRALVRAGDANTRRFTWAGAAAQALDVLVAAAGPH